MLVIELRFPAGRFHATPWGRHVNEGVVEWPPSPYRLARGLVDVWKRRHGEWPEARVEPLLAALSGAPRFALPAATAAHTRSYLSSNQQDPADKQLIFDAFVALDRDEPLCIGFDAQLPQAQRRDLAELLGGLSYLGRSESWVEARLVDGGERRGWNCAPRDGAFAGEMVPVACVRPRADYDRLPDLPHRRTAGGRAPRQRDTEAPCTWLGALCLSSTELQLEGWSVPPALMWTDFTLPTGALEPGGFPAAAGYVPGFREARYALASTVLPRVTETISVAERIRRRLMGIHRRVQGGDPALVSASFSGKDAEGERLQGHRHVFVLPLDEDGDGHIDHVVVRLARPFDEGELRAIDRSRSLPQSDGRPDIRMVLVTLSATPFQKQGSGWASVTPFITRRHYRRGRGTYQDWQVAEVRRECALHGLPAPTGVRLTSATPSSHREIPWFQFLRSRKGEAPFPGWGFALEFDRMVQGPFSLGAGCHLGLGLFQPMLDPSRAATGSMPASARLEG
ncbi:MAG: type I-U CRISPR-associated protein Cas5/Cas6 [Candidatus Schekmanbacteria bacterium]|nr:type I-U CRISPR-associated protein Cas5/Cas6 [Candidatus Schekmanbacteria bacterium]